MPIDNRHHHFYLCETSHPVSDENMARKKATRNEGIHSIYLLFQSTPSAFCCRSYSNSRFTEAQTVKLLKLRAGECRNCFNIKFWFHLAECFSFFRSVYLHLGIAQLHFRRGLIGGIFRIQSDARPSIKCYIVSHKTCTRLEQKSQNLLSFAHTQKKGKRRSVRNEHKTTTTTPPLPSTSPSEHRIKQRILKSWTRTRYISNERMNKRKYAAMNMKMGGKKRRNERTEDGMMKIRMNEDGREKHVRWKPVVV